MPDSSNVLRIDDPANGNWSEVYAIDPVGFNFTNATVTVIAKGKQLFKCKDWDFNNQTCSSGNWTKLQDITPGQEYTFTLTPEDPGFAESVSSCAAEDIITPKGTFGVACDDTTGASLEKNDGILETHTYKSSKYGGVQIQSVNTSITDCTSIDRVEICYEWWATAGDTLSDCDISVDADQGASYTAVTTTCPGTTPDPGVTCTNVTSLETWTCANFFGASGTRAQAKSEISRTNPGGATTATWDVLFFNVTYSVPVSDTTPPAYSTLTETPTDPATYSSGASYQFNVTWTDNIAVDKVIIEFDGVNYTDATQAGSIYTRTFTGLAVGTYNYKWYANDTFNNQNQTGVQTYTINQAADSVNLYLNGNLNQNVSITYETQSNATATATSNTEQLFRDGISVSNPEITTLAAGTYAYKTNSTGNTNYTASAGITYYLTVDKAASAVNLLLDGSDANVTVEVGSTINLTGQFLTGESTIELYQDGILINSGSSPLTNLTLFNTQGTYNITLTYPTTENYTTHTTS